MVTPMRDISEMTVSTSLSTTLAPDRDEISIHKVKVKQQNKHHAPDWPWKCTLRNKHLHPPVCSPAILSRCISLINTFAMIPQTMTAKLSTSWKG
jgi:hypothetical protein